VVEVRGEEQWNPTSREKRARCPEFPVRSSGQDRVCGSLKGEPHEVPGTHETTQEIGDVGHPALVAGVEDKSVPSTLHWPPASRLLKSETWGTRPRLTRRQIDVKNASI
jgi:hypothetical protein